MNTKRKISHTVDIRSEKGMALMMSLFLITVLTVLGVMVINTAIVETKVATNQKINSQVFYAAEAGLERGLKILEQELENNATDPWGDTNIEAPGFSVTAALVNGSTAMDSSERSMDMYLDGNLASGVRKLTFTHGGNTVGRAVYDLYMYTPNPTEVYLLSYAQSSDGAAAVEYHLRTNNDAPYANAVFSEAGVTINNGGANASTRLMTIAGSVYTRGHLSIAEGQKITNNYADADLPSQLADIINNVDDLGTRVRVYGEGLHLANNTWIGTASSDPPGAVATIETDKGITGPGSNNYYADEVGNEPADISLPTILEGLEQAYPGVSNNADYSGISNETDKAMAIYKDIIRGTGDFAPGEQYADPGATVTSKGVVIEGQGTISVPVGYQCTARQLNHDEWRSSRQTTDDGEIDIDSLTGDFQCTDALGNGVYYDALDQHLTVVGMLYVDEEFEIDIPITVTAIGAFEDDGSGTFHPPEDATEEQKATGASIIVGQEVEFNNSFTPHGGAGYCQGGENTNSIGWVVGNKIDFTSTTEGTAGGNPGHSDQMNYVVGYFFTPGTISVYDQMHVAGAFMAANFNLNGDVGVYQVPDLINYIPPLMPGDDIVVSFRDREWRRVF